MHIYVSLNWVTIGSGNSLSPVQCQTITWTNDDLLSVNNPLGTNFNEIWIKRRKNQLKKIHLKCCLQNVHHFVLETMSQSLARVFKRWFIFIFIHCSQSSKLVWEINPLKGFVNPDTEKIASNAGKFISLGQVVSYLGWHEFKHWLQSQITRVVCPTWGPPGPWRPQVGPTLAPLFLLSKISCYIGLCYNGTWQYFHSSILQRHSLGSFSLIWYWLAPKPQK